MRLELPVVLCLCTRESQHRLCRCDMVLRSGGFQLSNYRSLASTCILHAHLILRRRAKQGHGRFSWQMPAEYNPYQSYGSLVRLIIFSFASLFVLNCPNISRFCPSRCHVSSKCLSEGIEAMYGATPPLLVYSLCERRRPGRLVPVRLLIHFPSLLRSLSKAPP